MKIRSQLSDFKSAGNDINSLKNKITGLERDNHNLFLQLKKSEEAKQLLSKYNKENIPLTDKENSGNHLKKVIDLEKTILQLKSENTELITKLFELEQEQLRVDTKNEIKIILEENDTTIKPTSIEEDLHQYFDDDTICRIQERKNLIDFTRIGAGIFENKDNLQVIKGIGKTVELKLHLIGIFNYKQIANFNEDDIDIVNKAIEFFPGRILKDNWVKQAQKLI
jgi:predicted flap endonuclease-1-like 5' DNA nuclease